ncbi:hypothetical protein KIL84_005370 [Mauremys mutica]|uniref:Uncharacterized protein n=1 Tax=Mauremys mutica TaxID=74926 RepID=A0A9D3XHM3_9SAUR|nr:hypothetical protein KIL84_005370 [Mauremys mutica]
MTIHPILLKHHVILFLEVTDPTSVKAAAKKVGDHLKSSGLNLLINNAGMTETHMVDSANPEDVLVVYNTNLIGLMLVTQAFLLLLKKAAQGSNQKGMSCSKAAVINISMLWDLGSFPFPHMLLSLLMVCRLQAALNMLIRCQSLDYKEDGILFAALCPGWVKTDATSDEAPQTVDQSVSGILQVLFTLSEAHDGTFMNWEGKVVPCHGAQAGCGILEMLVALQRDVFTGTLLIELVSAEAESEPSPVQLHPVQIPAVSSCYFCSSKHKALQSK